MSSASDTTESATPSSLSPCQVCDRELRGCWQFQDDDHHCPLCGEEVLHFRAGQPSRLKDRITFSGYPEPGKEDAVVWLYWRPDEELELYLTWMRSLKGKPAKRRLRPVIDYSRSWARFSGDRVGELTFKLEELSRLSNPGVLVARLVPDGWHPKQVKLRKEGVRGTVSVACETMMVKREAYLLPRPQVPFTCTCTDPSLKGKNGELQIYQKNKAVPVRMQLAVEAPVWVMHCRPNGETARDITVTGFEKPVRIDPGKPYPFEMRVNTSDWQVNDGALFSLPLALLGLHVEPFTGSITLIRGSKLSFGDTSLQILQPLQLGQVFPTGFPLSISEATGNREDDRIQIERYEVHMEPDEGGWLRVIYPPAERPTLVVEPQSPGQLVLLVDTTRLDRRRFDKRLLKGRVELIDSRQRRWVCDLHVPVQRALPLDHAVAFDWGTTNSCAAYSVGIGPDKVPHPVFLDEQQKKNPEEFPSDIYFQDLSDPKKPVFLVGHEVTYHAEHPECCLHSVKRKFQLDKDVFVMDVHGNYCTYPVQQVVKFLLYKLVSQAEEMGKWEIRRLGFTFPTKWPPRVRRKLQQVAEELQTQLQEERSRAASTGNDPSEDFDLEVSVRPPEIDEANAVAINILTTRRDLPEKFYLIAYDFGGGTVDTSVLEVSLPRTTADPSTRYIGIGGRRDFGGDEVTRAVMMLLHARLTNALQARALRLDDGSGRVARLEEIPVVRDGSPLQDTGREDAADRYQKGRKNWDILWEIAEQVKISLCEPGGETNAVSGQLDPRTDRIWCRLSFKATATAGETREKQAAGTTDEFRSLLNVLKMLPDEDSSLDKDLNFTLADACRYGLEDLDQTNGNQAFTVEERIEDTIKELRWQCGELQAQCGRPEITPDIIVLAGGGCRLPLIAEKMRAAFPLKAEEHLIFDPKFSKQRVAHGLANYLFLKDVGDFGSGLARSVDVIHHPLGMQQRVVSGGLGMAFRTVAPVGTKIDAQTWHPFSFDPKTATRQGGKRRLMLFVQVWRAGAQEIRLGYFDLDRTCPPQDSDEPCLAEPLPEDGGGYQAELRLRWAGAMDVRVTVGGQKYGPYPLVPTCDVEAVLQG